jgi:DNA polymerase
VWCLSWRLGDGDVNRWHPGDEPPLDLIAHIEAGGEVIAQNAGFERVITNVVVRRDFPWWPELKIEQQDCTMARALALALPAGLDNLAIVLKLRSQKDKEGYNLMLRMCRPRSMSDDRTSRPVLRCRRADRVRCRRRIAAPDPLRETGLATRPDHQ